MSDHGGLGGPSGPAGHGGLGGPGGSSRSGGSGCPDGFGITTLQHLSLALIAFLACSSSSSRIF